jgi:hypothetical protein
MASPQLRLCSKCNTYNYLGSKRCNNPDCPRNRRAPHGGSSSSHATASTQDAHPTNHGWEQAEWWQHSAWQEQVWEDEKLSAKEKRRKWWAENKASKKQKREHHKAEDAPAPKKQIPSAGSNQPPKAPPVQPKQKAMPKPKPKPSSAKPPRGSAGRAPPWRTEEVSDDDGSYDYPRRVVETPGPLIEELLPELEWVPPLLELEDGQIPEAEEPDAPDSFRFGGEADEEGEEEDDDDADDLEIDIPSEMASRAAAAALKEADKAASIWNAPGGITHFFTDEPDSEPLAHVVAFSEPAAEPSPIQLPPAADDEEVS